MKDNKIISLYLFDFDDTLASTANVINVIRVVDDKKQPSEALDSEAFEQYRQTPESEREDDIIDFSDFDYVSNPVPLDNVIKIMHHAYSDSSSKVAIITARPSASRKDISKFLSAHGMTVADKDINTVGDSGGKPEHKLSVAKKYVETYSPNKVHFYDDSQKNNDAIMKLCEQINPGIEVYTFDVVDGSPVPDDNCVSFDSDRFMEIAGINKNL